MFGFGKKKAADKLDLPPPPPNPSSVPDPFAMPSAPSPFQMPSEEELHLPELTQVKEMPELDAPKLPSFDDHTDLPDFDLPDLDVQPQQTDAPVVEQIKKPAPRKTVTETSMQSMLPDVSLPSLDAHVQANAKTGEVFFSIEDFTNLAQRIHQIMEDMAEGDKLIKKDATLAMMGNDYFSKLNETVKSVQRDLAVVQKTLFEG